MPRGVTCLAKRKDRSIITPLVQASKGVTVKAREQKNGREISLLVSGRAGKVTVRRYNFPGWKVVDGQGNILHTSVTPKTGLIQFPTSGGTKHFIVVLTNTFVQNVGNSLSLTSVTMLFICSLIFGFWRKSPYNKKRET